MRFLKIGYYKILKILVFSILGIFSTCLVSCKKKLPEVHVHTKVHVLRIEPTCISEGRIEHWYCSQCNKVFKDKDASAEITWEEIKLSKLDHTIEKIVEITPTCENTGLTEGRYCTYCETIIQEQEMISALGHNYDSSSGIWNWEGFDSANFTVSCTHNEDHKVTYPATISSVTEPATCMEAGKIVYTAIVSINNVKYEDKKEEAILPLGHKYDFEKMNWVWEEDRKACVQIPCINDSTHIYSCDATLSTILIPATCTSNGKKTTTATVVIQGQSYSEIKEEELEAIGHDFDYENMEWTWEGYESASAIVTCLNDQNHKVSYAANITFQTKPATCTEEGKITYQATIVINEKSYFSYKEKTVPALNHDFNYNNYTWEWTDYTQAVIHFVCKHDATHLDSYAGQIHSSIEAATCVAEGKVVYSASVKVYNVYYEDKKEKILPIDEEAHDYNYEKPIWRWIPIVEGYTAFVEVTCKCGNSSLQFENTDIVVRKLPATFSTSGKIEYRAGIELEGKEYFDVKIEELPIKKYVSTEEEFLSAINAEAYDLTLSKDIILTQNAILAGRIAFLDLSGYMLMVQENSFKVTATHSNIPNGYLAIHNQNSLGKYVLSTDSQANLMMNSLTIFGGIHMINANAILRKVDITATLTYAINVGKGCEVVVESGEIRKNYLSEDNYFFNIEKAIEKEKSGSLSVNDGVRLTTTIDTTLFNPLGIEPKFSQIPNIVIMDVKEYISLETAFKCIYLSEDLIYSNEEDHNLLLNGKCVFIDLNNYTWFISAESLHFISSQVIIKNGNIFLSEEESGNVITIENGCTGIIENICTTGDIKINNSSVSLKNVIINATIKNIE